MAININYEDQQNRKLQVQLQNAGFITIKLDKYLWIRPHLEQGKSVPLKFPPHDPLYMAYTTGWEQYHYPRFNAAGWRLFDRDRHELTQGPTEDLDEILSLLKTLKLIRGL